MIAALAIGVGLLLVACVYCVGIGCRAVGQLCADLERDRQVEYRYPVPPTGHRSPSTAHRNCPAWLRRARA